MDNRSRTQRVDDQRRSRRVTLEQLGVLREFLTSHRDVGVGYNKSQQARAYSRDMWQKVATSLNSLEGAHKDWKEWAAYWTDYKCKLKTNIQKISSLQNGNGDPDPANEPYDVPLDNVEPKYLLIDKEQGKGTPDIQRDSFHNISTQESEDSSADDCDNAGEIQKADKRPRVTLGQLEVLYEFISSNREVVMRCRTPQAVAMWERVASSLNSLGPSKDWKQWAKYWTDYKRKLKTKIQKIRSSQINQTADDPADEPWNMPLEDIEQRFLMIIENHGKGITMGAQRDPIQNISTQESDHNFSEDYDNGVEIEIIEEADKRPRVSASQRNFLYEFLSSHRDISMGYNKNTEGRANFRTKWKKAARALNSLEGTNKNWRHWAKYWSNYKHTLKVKAQQIRSSQNETAHKPWDNTEIEKRFLLIIENDDKSTPPGAQRDPIQNMFTSESEDSLEDDSDTQKGDNRRHLSRRQQEVLYEFISSHRDIVVGCGRTPDALAYTRSLWEKAASSLNSLNGANKDWKHWAKYWADYKCRLKMKAQTLRSSQNETGIDPADEPLDNNMPLTETEKRFLLIIENFENDGKGTPPPEAQRNPMQNITPESKDSLEDDSDTQKGDKRRHLTPRQQDVLYEFISSHRDIAVGCGRTPDALDYKRSLWEKAASSLNALDGANKDWRRWSKYWSDYKCALKIKAQKIRSSQNETGIDTADEQWDSNVRLTDTDKRFLLIIENFENDDKSTPPPWAQRERIQNISTPESKDSLEDDSDTQKGDKWRRLTPRQHEVLYEFLSSHRDIVVGCGRTLEALDYKRSMWEKAASSLNSLEGANKDWRLWAKYWSDYKSNIKRRVNKIRLSRNEKGDVSACELLDGMEQKFALLIEKGTQEDTGRTPGTQEDPFENTSTQDSEVSSLEDSDYIAEEPTLHQQDAPKTSEQNEINIQSSVSADPCRNCHQSKNGVSNEGLDIQSLPVLNLTPLNTVHNQLSSTIEYIDLSQRQPNLTHEVPMPNTAADEHTYFSMSLAPLMRSLPPGVASGLRIRMYQMIHDATELLKLENENPLAM